ncbi:MAG: 3'-5' exonuclease [Brachybacterium tyrofermentans]
MSQTTDATIELGMPLVFVDTETTMLEPTPKPWEIALIKRAPGALEDQLHIMIRNPDLSDASPDSLRVARLYERHPQWTGVVPTGVAVMDAPDAARAVERFTALTQLAGSNPDFDARALEWLLRQHGLRPRWRHHSINLVTWTYPVLLGRGEQVKVPTSSYDLSRRVGVEPPSAAEAHTAMGDARWTMRWWDTLTEVAR